jgi:hypothetical protein
MVKHEFFNFGYVKVKVPTEIMSYIHYEVDNRDNSTENSTGISGVIAPGSMTHYNFKNPELLKDYVLEQCQLYLNAFYSAIDYKLKSDGIDPEHSKIHAMEPWINIQKCTEWLPPHDHSGLVSYTIWVSLPETSTFEFIYTSITGETMKKQIILTPENEGELILFPSKILHCVHPFFNSETTRITVAGNIGISN